MFAKGDNYSASKRAQSQGGHRNADLSGSINNKKDLLYKAKKATFGLDVNELKRWKKENVEQELGQESAKQEIAVSKVKSFLDAIATTVFIQSWWRMIRIRREYNAIMNQRKELKRRCYRGWKIFWKSERLHLYHILGKFFQSWREEIRDEKRLKKTIARFFAICIKRMKLTPQAIMAFFNPGEWSDVVAHEDRMKIRRMVLLKLFHGWKNESHDLKIMRYKASQILSRMVRRTKGPLWVKESTLVCFHMWFRYTVVKNCYRRGELDPTFKNPYLPQWAKLYKDITLSRVKKKRTLETGQLLTQRRAWGKWRYLMTVDRSKPVTPLAVAINHYNTVLSNKMIKAWYLYVRERGRAMRYAERIFYAWQQWAPKHRKLRQFNDIATEWVRLQRVRRSFNVMTKICETMISMRSEKIKELRKIFCDRKVVICAYALLNKNEHVMMVDCWRKLVCFWKGRRRWKALNWHYNYSWFAHKAREILHAWRTAAIVRREARLRGDNDDDISVESFLTSADHNSIGGDSAMDALFAHLSGKDNNSNHLMTGFWDEGNRLFFSARKDELSLKPSEKEFLFMCLMWSKYWTQIQFYAKMSSEEYSRHILHDPKLTIENMTAVNAGGTFIPKNLMPLLEKGDASSVAASSIASTAATYLNPTNPDNFNHTGIGIKLPYNNLYKESWNPDKQQKLQKAVDYALLPEILTILNEMPLYEAQFIKQIMGHLGDHYVPIFALLLMGSVCFLAERMIKKDKNAILLQCHSPINAFILGSQLARWEKVDLTTRELSMFTQDAILTDMNGSPFHSMMLWRLVFLHFLDNRCIQMARTCRTLPVTRSMETEVAEVLKRNKVVKMISLYRSVLTSLGFEPEWTVDSRSNELIPPLVFDSSHKMIVVATDESETPDVLQTPTVGDNPRPGSPSRKKNIYYVLREYLLLTGKLAKEAKALRDPLMERDAKLIVSGFLKQARKDYLALRRECMTKKEIQAEKEKKEKEAEKQARLQRKAEAKAKARRKAAKLKKKKEAKASLKASMSASAKSNFSFNPSDTGEIDPPDNEGDDAGGDGAETGGESATEGGADTDTNLMSPTDGGGTSFDEKDFDKSRSSIIRELFDELSLVEESEILEERDFQERVSSLESPVYIETWIPMQAWIQDSEVRKNYEMRMKRELRLALKRIFFVMQHQDGFGPFNYQMVRNQFQGVGMFMIDTVLGDHTPQQAYRNSPLWLVLPKEYWSFRQVKERMFREQAFIDGLVNGMKERLDKVENANEELDSNISKYQKFLKKVRKQVVDIAQKQVQKDLDDEKEKASKIQLIKKTEKSIAANQRKIQAINEKVRMSDVMMASSNLEGVYELLKPPPALDENGNPIVPKKKDEALPTTAAIMQMIEDIKQKAQDHAKTIQDLEAKKQKMESELKAYTMYCQRATKLLKNLAEDRFNTMIDLQLLTNRVSKSLDSAEVEELEMKKFRKFNNKYLRALQHFFDDNISSRGMQLTKEAELRKIQELMNRPSVISTSGASLTAPNATTVSPSNHGDIRRTHSLEEKGPISPASQQRSLSSKHIKTDPTIPSSRRAGLMTTFHLEEDQGVEQGGALEEGSDEVNSLRPDNFGDTSAKMDPLLRGASSISYENTDSTVLSNIQQGIASRPLHDQMMQSSLEGGDEEDDDPIVELSLASKLEAVPINRSLTIEEEIELLHYNSPENIAKREEELRQLAIQKADELAHQELRMKIFDDYWTAYPRKEVAPDYSIRKKEKPAPKSAPVEYIEPAKRVIKTRSERMWKSVGEAYWRAKREHIENLIRAQGDLSGLDPESIADVIMRRRDSIDPLDFEFDLLPEVEEEDDQLEEGNGMKKYRTFAQQFVEPFEEMSTEIWQSPVRPTTTTSSSRLQEPTAISMSVSMKKLPKFPLKTGEMPTTNIATALFNPEDPVLMEGPPMSANPDAVNRDMVSASEVQLLGEDPPRVKGTRDKAKAKVDPFAITGAAEFKRIREGIQGRAMRSINLDDDEFSVSTRTGGNSSAGYITLEDRSDSSTFYQLKAETLIAKKKAQKMNAMNGNNDVVLSPIKSVPGSPGSRDGSIGGSRGGSARKPISQQGSVRSRFTDEEEDEDDYYEGDAEGDGDRPGSRRQRSNDIEERSDEDDDNRSENSSISSHPYSHGGTHASSVEHRRQVAEYLELINDGEKGEGVIGADEATKKDAEDTHLTDAQKRSQRFREFKDKRNKRQTFAAATGTDLLKATMLLTQQKEKQQQQMEEFKKSMMNKVHASKEQHHKQRSKRRRGSHQSTGSNISEVSANSQKRLDLGPAPISTPAPTTLTRTASSDLIAIAMSRHVSEENSLLPTGASAASGVGSVYSGDFGHGIAPSMSVSRADSEVMSIGSSMHKSLQRSVRYLEENDEMLKPPGNLMASSFLQQPPPEDLSFAHGQEFVAVRNKDGSWSLVPSETPLPTAFMKDRGSPTQLFASSVLGGIPVDGGPLVLEGKAVFQPIPCDETDLHSQASSRIDPELLQRLRLIHTLGLRDDKMSDSIRSSSSAEDEAPTMDDRSKSPNTLLDLVHEFKEKQDAARKAKEEANLLSRSSPTKEQQIAAILKQYQKPISFVPAYFRQNQPAGSSTTENQQVPLLPFLLKKGGSGINFTDDVISNEVSRDASPTHSRTASLDGEDMSKKIGDETTIGKGDAMQQHLLRVVGEHIDSPSPTSGHGHQSGKHQSSPSSAHMSPSLTMRVSIPTPKLLQDRLMEADNNAMLNSKRMGVDGVPVTLMKAPSTGDSANHDATKSGSGNGKHQEVSKKPPTASSSGSRPTSAGGNPHPLVPKLSRQYSDTYSDASYLQSLSEDYSIAAAQPIPDSAVIGMAQQLRDYIRSRENVLKERQALQQEKERNGGRTASPGKLRNTESVAHEIRHAGDQVKNIYSEQLPRSPASPLHPFHNSTSLSPNSLKQRGTVDPLQTEQQRQPRVMFDSAVTWFEPITDELRDLDDHHDESAMLVKQTGSSGKSDFWIDVSKTSNKGLRTSSRDNIGNEDHSGQHSVATPVSMVIPNTPLLSQQLQQEIFPRPSDSAAEKPRRSLKEDRDERSLGPRVVLKAKKLQHPHNEVIPEDRFLANYKRVSRIVDRSLTESELRHPSQLDVYDIATKELEHEMIEGVPIRLVEPTHTAATSVAASVAMGPSSHIAPTRSRSDDDAKSTGSIVPMIPLALHQHRQQSPPALHHPKGGRHGNNTTPRSGLNGVLGGNSARSNSAAALQIINEIAGEQYRMGDSVAANNIVASTFPSAGASVVSNVSASGNVGGASNTSGFFASGFPSFADIPMVVISQDGAASITSASQGSSAYSPKKGVGAMSANSSLELAAFVAPQLIPSAPSHYHLVPENTSFGESPWSSTMANGKGGDVTGLMVVATPARVITKPNVAIAAIIPSVSTPALPPSPSNKATNAASTAKKNDNKNETTSKSSKKEKNESVTAVAPLITSGSSSQLAKKLEDQIELSRLTSPYIDPSLLVSTPRSKTPHTISADAAGLQLDRALALNSMPITPNDHEIQADRDAENAADEASVEKHIKVKINRYDENDSQRSRYIDDEDDEEDDANFEEDLNEELRSMLRSESAPASLHAMPTSASFASLKQLAAVNKRQQLSKPSLTTSVSAPQIAPSSPVGKAQFPSKLETGVKIPGHNPQSGLVPSQSNASKNPFHGVKRKKQLQLPPLLSPAPVVNQVASVGASTMPNSVVNSNKEGFIAGNKGNQQALEFSSSMPITKVTPKVKGKVLSTSSSTADIAVEDKAKKTINPSLRGAREAYLQMLQQTSLDSQSISADSKVSSISVRMERKGGNSAGMPTY